jgi:hypothetical protein
MTPTTGLISLWGTALIKGDLKLLWDYNEEGEEKDKETDTTNSKKQADKPDPEKDRRQLFLLSITVPRQSRPLLKRIQAKARESVSQRRGIGRQ